MEEDAQQQAAEAALLRALAEQESAREQALQDHRDREHDTSAADAWTQAPEQPFFWENPLGWFQETPLYADGIEPYFVQPATDFVTSETNKNSVNDKRYGKAPGHAKLVAVTIEDQNCPWWKFWDSNWSWQCVTDAWNNYWDSEQPISNVTPTASQIQFPTLTSTATPTITIIPTFTSTPSLTPAPLPTILLQGRPKDLYEWTRDLGRTTSEFCGAVLQREAFPAWRDDRWFDGREDDPAKIFTEASVRWYWSWTKYLYGEDVVKNDANRELLIYEWLHKGVQSEDKITKPLLEQYFGELNPSFTVVCNEILRPTNLEWATGNSMWSWANAYMYNADGRRIAAQNHKYEFGSGCAAWYIFDGLTVAQLEPQKIPVPDCK